MSACRVAFNSCAHLPFVEFSDEQIYDDWFYSDIKRELENYCDKFYSDFFSIDLISTGNSAGIVVNYNGKQPDGRYTTPSDCENTCDPRICSYDDLETFYDAYLYERTRYDVCRDFRREWFRVYKFFKKLAQALYLDLAYDPLKDADFKPRFLVCDFTSVNPRHG